MWGRVRRLSEAIAHQSMTRRLRPARGLSMPMLQLAPKVAVPTAKAPVEKVKEPSIAAKPAIRLAAKKIAEASRERAQAGEAQDCGGQRQARHEEIKEGGLRILKLRLKRPANR